MMTTVMKMKKAKSLKGETFYSLDSEEETAAFILSI